MFRLTQKGDQFLNRMKITSSGSMDTELRHCFKSTCYVISVVCTSPYRRFPDIPCLRTGKLDFGLDSRTARLSLEFQGFPELLGNV